MTINIFTPIDFDAETDQNIRIFLHADAGARVVVCANIHDYKQAGLTGTTLVDRSPTNTIYFTKVTDTDILATSGGKLYTQIWISTVCGINENKELEIQLYPTGINRRVVCTSFSVAGLTSDDSQVFDNSTKNGGNNNLPNTTSITPAASLDSLIVAAMAWDEDDNHTVVNPSGGFTGYGWEEEPGNPDTQGVTATLATKITNVAGQTTVGIQNTAHWNALTAVFKGATQNDKQHTTDSRLTIVDVAKHETDSILRATIDKTHTTDSILSAENAKFHSADTLLQATSDIIHTADSFLRPPQRPPVLRRLLINSVPSAQNIGENEVNILGMHGNGVAPNTFTYTLNPQEFVVGKNRTNKINIIDPIIKKADESES